MFLLLTLITVEALLFPLFWHGFNIESKLRDRYDDQFDDAKSGFQSGKIVPAVATLIDAVNKSRSPSGDTLTTLDFAEINRPLQAVIASAALVNSLESLRKRLIRAWTVSAAAIVAVQIFGAVVFVNSIANSSVVSGGIELAAIVLASGAIAILVSSLILCRNLDRALGRAVDDGRRSGRES